MNIFKLIFPTFQIHVNTISKQFGFNLLIQRLKKTMNIILNDYQSKTVDLIILKLIATMFFNDRNLMTAVD